MQARQRGQAVVEAALTSMLVILTLLVTLQLALVAAQMFSAMYVAQSTARWLAVNIDAIDSELTTRAATVASGMPGMGTGNAGTSTSGLVSVAANPGCLQVTPAPPATGGKCTLRESGDPVTVTVTPKLSAVLFLPATYGIPPYVFRLPASLSAVSYTVMLE